MDTDRKWVIVRIDGKIAAISTDYRALAAISSRLMQQKSPAYGKITAETVGFDEVWDLRHRARWNDLLLFGTEFQKKVWKKLWELTHSEKEDHTVGTDARLLSYSDFAEMCQNRAGVRAVAHAIGLNPIAILIPCHLVVPKECIDRITEIQKKAESNIFKGSDLCMDNLLNAPYLDFGEYAYGRKAKRFLIRKEFSI